MSYNAKTDWQYKEKVRENDISRWEQGIADAVETAEEALGAVDEALEAAETANTAAETATAAAESANTAVEAIYSDKNFYVRKNSNSTLSLVYDDGE